MKLAIPKFIAAALALLTVSGACSGTAAADRGYSLSSIKGAYAGIFTGQANTGQTLVPLLGTGIFISDGNGNLSGHESYTFGTTHCDATISGIYTVDSDGTGTDAATFTTSSPGCTTGNYTQSLAIGDGGKLALLSNSNGDQINEEWHRQK
ncbi:MAG TPA: hypothetical protein VMT58_01725 [Candidatus Binataceae bacterium]|nr:hypothetical protein [Candidatus Binataceae bacterium]